MWHELSVETKQSLNLNQFNTRGGARNFPMEGADSSEEGAKIWFSGYYKCQKSPKNSLFIFRQGASMLRRGL